MKQVAYRLGMIVALVALISAGSASANWLYQARVPKGILYEP